jgi:hypothetical protein
MTTIIPDQAGFTRISPNGNAFRRDGPSLVSQLVRTGRNLSQDRGRERATSCVELRQRFTITGVTSPVLITIFPLSAAKAYCVLAKPTWLIHLR